LTKDKSHPGPVGPSLLPEAFLILTVNGGAGFPGYKGVAHWVEKLITYYQLDPVSSFCNIINQIRGGLDKIRFKIKLMRPRSLPKKQLDGNRSKFNETEV
jgi:hypothetical protein